MTAHQAVERCLILASREALEQFSIGAIRARRCGEASNMAEDEIGSRLGHGRKPPRMVYLHNLAPSLKRFIFSEDFGRRYSANRNGTIR